MSCERIARVEWHRSGRDEALKWLAQAEALAREFECRDAPAEARRFVALPLVSQSLFWAYADKAGRRDATQAMALAKLAYECGGDECGGALNAMACAFAANGQFEEAVKWARRTDLIASDVLDKQLIQARIQRFLDRKLPDDEFLELMTAAKPADQAAK